MGMCMGLTTLGDANIRRVLADPPLIWLVVAPDDPSVYAEARADAQQSWTSRIFGRGKERAPAVLDLSPVEGRSIGLDKAWNGIHYLLTGSGAGGAYPHAFLLNGGAEVGDIDVGYGPARVFTSAESRKIHETLNSLTDEALRARFDAQDMLAQKVYPEIWDRPPAQDDSLGYLVENVQVLRAFLAQAASANVGIVITLE